MGGYGGAAVAHADFKALILAGWTKPVLFIFLSPVIGLVVAVAVTILTSWIVRRQRPLKVDRWFRRLQLLSAARSEEHTSELQSRLHLVCRLLLEKKKTYATSPTAPPTYC